MAAALFFLSVLRAVAAESLRWPPEVRVDPRFELLAVVHVLADPDGGLEGFRLNSTAYSQDVEEAFGGHASHEAVKLYADYRRAGADSVAAQKLMLDLSDPPELSSRRALSPEEARLVEALRAFWRQSDFADFVASHKDYYRRLEQDVRDEMEGRDYAAMLRDYTGLPIESRYTVILVSLRAKNQGNMNHVGCGEDRARHIFSAIGPALTERGKPRFHFWDRRWDVWHELGHTLFDDLLEKYPASARAARARFETLLPRCYGSADQCLREHIVQGLAFAVLSWAHESGRTEESVWSPAVKPGMPHLGLVVAGLKEYETRRNRYPTLAGFYPRLLDVLAGSSGEPSLALSGSPIEPAHSSCRAEDLGRRPGLMDPLKPSPLNEGASMTAEDYKRRGVWFFSSGEFSRAVEDFLSARALDPGDAEIHLNLSVALHRLDRLEEALSSADEALRRAARPSDRGRLFYAEILSTRASLLLSLRHPRRARADLEEALRTAPEDWPRRRETEKRLEGL